MGVWDCWPVVVCRWILLGLDCPWVERVKEVYVITYDHPHRRTEELVFKLLVQGIKPKLLLLPWETRKARKPLVDLAKPSSLSDPRDYCKHLGLEFCNFFFLGSHFPDDSRFLIGGAGILEASFVQKHEVINAHPGKIPLVRGLDALKWAIFYGSEIYVTLHRVDAQTDMGTIITQRSIPLRSNDTYHSIADRMWYEQIDLLAGAGAADVLIGTSIAESAMDPNRRMGAVEEMVMIERLKDRLRGING